MIKHILLLSMAMVLMAGGVAAAPRIQEHMGPVEEYYYPHLHNLVWDEAVPGRVFATSPIGGWRSDDGGRSWYALSPDTPNLHYGRLLFERTRRTMYLYRRGDPQLYQSSDQGATWAVISQALFYQLELVPGSPGSLYAIHGDWRLRRSDDGGVSWRELARPGTGGDLLLGVAPGGTLYAITGMQLYRSNDGGKSWAVAGAWPVEAHPRELLVAGDGSLIAGVTSDDQPSVSAKALLRSTNEGATWQSAPLQARHFAVLRLAGATLWVGSDDGRVWRLVDIRKWDEAAAWHELPIQLARPRHEHSDIPYTPLITEIAPGPGGVVLVGSIHGIYRASGAAGPALLRARGLLPTGALPSNPLPGEHGQPGTRYFPETGHRLGEPFLSAWQRLGGLAGPGYPRTEPFIERNLDSGTDELVQYFERARLGTSLNGGPVRPGRIVPPLLAEQGLSFPTSKAKTGCRYVTETQHNLCGAFLEAWHNLGGVALLGLPLSEAQPVATTPEGPPLVTQWFERGRLTQQNGPVEPALIGNEELRIRGWLP